MLKPMLAVEAILPKIVYPVYASPKLDGLRCLIIDGKPFTRSLKPFPNKHVDACLSHAKLNGLDGELIVGEPTAKDVYRQSTSHLMAREKDCKFTFFVFDITGCELEYKTRLELLKKRMDDINVCSVVNSLLGEKGTIELLEQELIKDEEQLLDYENRMLDLGYEGLILRSLDGEYKHGRSTVKEGLLLKLKRFKDSEAAIIGFEEQMFNGNEAMTNELGRTKRSSHKAGKVGKATLGALIVRDVHTQVEFRIGTGMDDPLRQYVWDNQAAHVGQLVKYKYFPVGVKDLPRHPVFLGFRSKEDMS